jgi:uncharacterized RDD family membrane protein YckC
VLCPRCSRDNPGTAATCAACGAPLAFGDEPPARPLEVTLPIDRRGPVRTPPPARVEPAAAPVRPAERSHWELGSGLAPSAGEPTAADEGIALEAHEAPPEADVEALEVRLRRPPPWRRAAAWLLDAVPLAALAGVLASLLFSGARPPDGGILGALDFVAREGVIVLPLAAFLVLASLVYFTLGHALMGATVGKALLGLRVVGPDGRRPSLARSAGRSAAVLLSIALFGLGCLLALFTRSGRALHDWIAGTWVVERP